MYVDVQVNIGLNCENFILNSLTLNLLNIYYLLQRLYNYKSIDLLVIYIILALGFIKIHVLGRQRPIGLSSNVPAAYFLS